MAGHGRPGQVLFLQVIVQAAAVGGRPGRGLCRRLVGKGRVSHVRCSSVRSGRGLQGVEGGAVFSRGLEGVDRILLLGGRLVGVGYTCGALFPLLLAGL